MRSFEARSDTNEKKKQKQQQKKNMPNRGNKQGSLHLPLVVKKMHARSLSTTAAKTAQQEALIQHLLRWRTRARQYFCALFSYCSSVEIKSLPRTFTLIFGP